MLCCAGDFGSDAAFFRRNPDRKTRLRLPAGDECASTFDRMRPHSLEERRIVVIRASVTGELFPDDRCSPMAVVATDALRDTDAALWPVVVQAAMTLLEDARGGLH